MDQERFWRRWAYGATLFVGLLVVFGWVFLEEALDFVAQNEALFKLIGQGLGPCFALLAFIWGLYFKAELASQAAAAGAAKTQAEEARRRADEEASRVDAMKTAVEEKEERIRKLEDDLRNIAQGAKLWSLRDNAPFPEYPGWKYDPPGAKIVTVGLFKGGVGKTHIAANFAAYMSEKRHQRVLLIDLDFQGSLSTELLVAAGLELSGSLVDRLFDESADLATVCASKVHLAPVGETTILNRGRGMPRAWIVPADYTLARVEGDLLAKRIVGEPAKLDERYRLAHVLLNPQVRREFELIIIDTPPRMTLGTVNALLASHAIIVPAILDRVSSEAFKPYLSQIDAMQKDLDVSIDLAGVVASMTRQNALTDQEQIYLKKLEEVATSIFGARRDGKPYVLPRNLPVKAAIRTSSDLGYFLTDANGSLATQFYDPLFDDLCERLGL